ncbi:hypothetical protein K490DRAFT_46593 [Saccharata proteae CBS 121410]|uniref:Anaphase-promoting complex subunit 4 n=1 Tax=Saccharata proteae CBS 121410 TaxID=1314787 RepID=A0A9P4HS23_9PEZI|nr:hypothetical protein K490DRAFT_46593 [Saccharata proteae CBS 121410]
MPEFMLQAEKALPHAVHAQFLSYCPTMDLVAVVTQEEQLEVYRLNGQRAFSHKRKDTDNKVKLICWKFNGQHIAVAWLDGSIDVLSSETGKVVKQIQPEVSTDAEGGAASQISCLGWGVNFIDIAAVRSRLKAARESARGSQYPNFLETVPSWQLSQDELTLDDFLERMPDLRKLGITPDLPKQLALIDAQDVLPKLPMIPSPPAIGMQMMSKATTSDAFGSQQSKRDRLALVPLTLRFIPSAGIYLHLIASKTAQLQNLLQYIQSSLKTISTFFLHSQDLPGRFMRNVNETLMEKDEGTLVDNFFHMAVTGDCPTTIKEWLVDELTESGHKRWDHASNQGYSKVIDLTHENLLPALDRCSIIVSRLRGLARYHDTSLILNVPENDLSAVLDTIQCLRLLAHNILTYAAQEKRQFLSFSKWLRYVIDVQATDPSSTTADEMAEKDPGINYEQLLTYIPCALSGSMIQPFLRDRTAVLTPPSTAVVADITNNMKLHKQGKPVPEGGLCAWSVFDVLRSQCRTVFKQITSWQAANSSMGCGLYLEDTEMAEIKSMRMIDEKLDSVSDMATYIAVVPVEASNQLRMHRVVHSDVLDNIDNCVRQIQSIIVQLPEGEIKDVKFIDDSALMLLFKAREASYLITFPYNQDGSDGHIASLYRCDPNSASPSTVGLPDGECPPVQARPIWRVETIDDLLPHVKHVFPASERFSPIKIDVNGRKDRRVVCVLGDDLKHFKVYDLDYEGEGLEGDVTFTTLRGGDEDTVMSDD